MSLIRTILTVICTTTLSISASAQSDTVFVFSPGPNDGLHVAVRAGTGAPQRRNAAVGADVSQRPSVSEWLDLGRVCSSDYGTWGVEKRMYHPSLCRAADGSWRLVFQVNDRSPLFAASYSRDLVNWRPQDYPRVSTRQCLKPFVRPSGQGFEVVCESEQGLRLIGASYDFRHFTADVPVPSAATVLDAFPAKASVTIDGQKREGQLFALTPAELAAIRRHFEQGERDRQLSDERMHDDAENLKDLPATVSAKLTIDTSKEKAISDKLIGIFFEDISYAADGGLYAELIQNRDFEYSGRDHKGWEPTTAWHKPASIVISTDDPLTPQNPHHALVTNDSLWNEGWDGIAVTAGEKYDFSMFVRGKKNFTVQLIAPDGTAIATAQITATARKGAGASVGTDASKRRKHRRSNYDWHRYSCTLTAKKTEPKARLLLLPQGRQPAAIDMVSLFPQKTFKNRKNGLRSDLAQVIADLHPKFVRFPGGCMSHGQGLDNIYHWHHTIGPLESRTPDFNIWHYHQTRGLGFFEYFQFCEDIGAEPLPVLAAGVPCQNSANNAEGVGGQQGGIPWQDMPAYIDELCNLIDWANGDPATNQWAKMRADAGHPAPFNLKYIGIGNEDIISTVFEQRYEMICRALHERHPEIKVCGTVGPFHAPSADYMEGWDFTRRHPGLQYMVDEHYYESTGWFINHRDYYDSYPREDGGQPSAKVYLGEWAASTRVKRPNVETALAEALYLTDIERNGDIVEMTSYAPMLCKDGHSNWNPDMIYFSNTSIRTTPAYEIQRLFSVYSGDRYVSSQLSIDSPTPDPQLVRRLGASLVRDSKTGRRYLKLVNALPTTLTIAVEGLSLPAKVKCEQFTGPIDDQKAKAEVIETTDPTTLPPYSLRVIAL